MEFGVEGGDGRLEIGIRYLPHYEGLEPISRMTSGSSGYDVVAACRDEIAIRPGRTAAVSAGFELSIPAGFEAQVRPRSGLALKSRIGLLNSPGTIDSDYRGEVLVILYNFGEQDYIVRRGDRIAQLVFCRLPAVRLVERVELDRTDRGSGGFGHTG
jgi:dUTP pyrophosphatase